MLKKMILDEKQQKIWQKLKELSLKIENSQKTIFSTIFGQKQSTKSIYLYGFPGRGKTMLMQKFYHDLKKTKKVYFHFNDFMRAIHLNLRDIRLEEKKYNDELIEAVKRIIKDKKVLCFDEFQVLDIADAMLLGRIFSYLFKQKIIVIFTSNSKPQDLYLNGLQREIFLEFVEKILLKNVEVLSFQDDVDYRLLHKKNLTKRYFVSNQKNRLEVKKIIKSFVVKAVKPRIIKVWGREVIIKKTFEKIAIINFDEICKQNLSAADYQEICKEFDLIFLLKLPIFTAQDRNEARRFMLFIDEIYENKTALIILAKTKIDKIYQDEKDKKSNARVISRLKEIKSDFYWNNSKLFYNAILSEDESNNNG